MKFKNISLTEIEKREKKSGRQNKRWRKEEGDGKSEKGRGRKKEGERKRKIRRG